MLDLLLFAAAFAGGYAACIYSWPTVKIWANGISAEVVSLRAKAQQLENRIRGR
jgi:outer membrane murein-binding lipoprotein Lpp